MKLSDSSSYEPDSAGTQLYLSCIIPCMMSINRFEIDYCCAVLFWFVFYFVMFLLILFAFCLVLQPVMVKLIDFISVA